MILAMSVKGFMLKGRDARQLTPPAGPGSATNRRRVSAFDTLIAPARSLLVLLSPGAFAADDRAQASRQRRQ